MRTRVGCIRLTSKELMREGDLFVKKIITLLEPTSEVIIDYSQQHLFLRTTSNKFREIADGTLIPNYGVITRLDDNGDIQLIGIYKV